jgi:glutathione synthase
MHVCFIVTDVKNLKPRHGGVYLAWAAHRNGHEVRFVSVDDLSYLDDNSVLGRTVRTRAGDYPRPADYLRALSSDEAVREEEALSRFDVVFLRYNPLLESAAHAGSPVIDLCWRLRLGGTLVINDPEGVRRAGSGMYLADLPPEVRVRTLVSRARPRLREFLRSLDGPAVLKALSPSGAAKMFYVRRKQKANVNQILSALTKEGYVVAQEYLPEADHGEKRVVLLGGEPIRFGDEVAIYRRVPLLRGGLNEETVVETPSSKGRRKRCEFGPGDARLCDILRPKLLADGLYFVSVDLVGDKILDLNVFTPSGLHSLQEIYGVDVAEIVIRDLERRVRLRAAYRTTFDPEAANIV